MTTLKAFGTISTSTLRCTMIDTDVDVCKALAAAFSDVGPVEVVNGNMLDLACDAIVSPANSFGDMSGGIDKAIDDFHGGEAQRRLMGSIGEQFFGELPVVTRTRPIKCAEHMTLSLAANGAASFIQFKLRMR